MTTARGEGEMEGYEKGLEKGIEKGRAEGAQDKALEIARNMKSMGLSLDQIANITGLSIDVISSL